MTLSEKLFEQLCNSRQIRFEPILRVSGQQTADYRIWLADAETIVEVKQIERSEHEIKLIASGEDEESPAVISDIQTRIRNKFDKAKTQLKSLSGGKLHTILVIYDNTSGLSGMDNEAFMNAMQGDEVIELTLERKTRKVVRTVHTYGSKNRKVGQNHNRTVSALGRLLLNESGHPMLFLFHNEFSTNSLPMEAGSLIAAKQFVRPPSQDNGYRQWTETSDR